MAASAKVYDFILVFKGRSHTPVNVISRIMLLIAIAGLVAASIPIDKRSITCLVISAAILVWWVYTEIRLRKGRTAYFRFAFLLAAVGWYLQPGGLIMAVIYLVAALMEKQVKFPDEVAFDENEIVFNSFPRKHFDWNVINNVVLKDGILTIDFKTNRLIQNDLESFPSVKEEAEFNEFCRERLKSPE